ncbi:hypothetical protein ACF0H5_003494 [Mactra antiquata]
MLSETREATNSLFVAAIDFGTTYSGWAILSHDSFKDKPTSSMIKHWYSGYGVLTTEKTPTVALIKPDGVSLESFGYEAENRYRELLEEDAARDYYYFQRFKMALMKPFGDRITEDILLEDEMSKKLSAITVFSLAIKYLVDDVMTDIKKKCIGVLMSDFTWVLTVPAIWTDSAKKFMRLAAEKAGISSDKLLIALEPECASICCRYLPVHKRIDETGTNMSTLPTGSKFMTIDTGVMMAKKIGDLRRKHKIAPPETTGPPEFIRAMRAQQNGLEFGIPFQVVLWSAGIFAHQVPAAILGSLYVFSRRRYNNGYIQDADKRVGPFWMGVRCLQGLVAVALGGIINTALSQYAGLDMFQIVRQKLF